MTDPSFLPTRQYQRFTEFADAVRRDRYIGLCYGPPGVGKTVSARHYSRWGATAAYLARLQQPTIDRFGVRPPTELASVRTVLWTTPVSVTAGQIHRELADRWCHQVDEAIRGIPAAGWRPRLRGSFPHVELVIVDEATGSRPPAWSSCATCTTATTSA